MLLDAHGRLIETNALGSSISLLADPNNFTVGLMSITLDTNSFALAFASDDIVDSENGLFVFFKENLSSPVIHSITIGAQTSGIWNLVAIQ